MKRLSIFLATLALVAAGCGGDDATDTTEDEATFPPTTSAVSVDPSQQILEIRFEGGLAPIEFLFGRGPAYTLFGDGRLVSESPKPAIFPGPLLTRFSVADIGAEGVNEVLSAVRAAGLPGIIDEVNTEAANFIADVGNTVITYTDESGDHRYSVYALGAPEIETSQLRLLQGIVDLVDHLAATSASTVLEIERLQVTITPALEVTEEPGAVVVDWPLTATAADAMTHRGELRCLVVDGDEVAEVLPILEAANQLTLFDDGTEAYQLFVRQLLPAEEGCTGA